MLEPLQQEFFRNALIGGILVGALASYYGVFVVQRRLAFMGSGLSHAAFGGIALGMLLGWTPMWVALPFTVAIAIAIVWVRDRTALASDTTIGIFFSLSMAAGIIFLSMKEGYASDAFTFLFGSILAVRGEDIVASAAVCVGTLLLLPLWGRWAYATFDQALARADRLRVTAEDYLLTICLAVVIVVSIKVVGIILISAFLVLPAATARIIARTFASMTLFAVLIGVSTVVVGLFASYHSDLPSGATIILVQSTLFFAALVSGRYLRA